MWIKYSQVYHNASEKDSVLKRHYVFRNPDHVFYFETVCLSSSLIRVNTIGMNSSQPSAAFAKLLYLLNCFRTIQALLSNFSFSHAFAIFFFFLQESSIVRPVFTLNSEVAIALGGFGVSGQNNYDERWDNNKQINLIQPGNSRRRTLLFSMTEPAKTHLMDNLAGNGINYNPIV